MAEQTPRSTVVKKSRAQWEADRAALIAETGLTYGALREYGETWQLRDGERSRWETIRRINAILKDEPEGDFRGKAPEPDWADVREAARNAGWSGHADEPHVRIWGANGTDRMNLDWDAGSVRVFRHGLVVDLAGPSDTYAHETVHLINPTPARVLAAARLIGLGGTS